MKDSPFYFPCFRPQYCSMCPAMQDLYRDLEEPYDEEFEFDDADFDEIDDILDDFYEDSDIDDMDFFEDAPRSVQDVNRVVNAFEIRFRNLIDELQRAGIDRRLLRFLIRTVVAYIDDNFNRYRGTLERKINAAIRDIRLQLPWIISILRVFGVLPRRIVEILREIVSFAFQNLRRPMPVPAPPPTPRPR